MTNIKVKKLHNDAIIPKRAHTSDAGFDIYAIEDSIIEPGETALIKTGLAFELPDGYEMQIRPRSGITLKTKLRVQLGTIDCGYVGEVGVIVDNINRDRNVVPDYYLSVDGGHVSAIEYFGAWNNFEKGSYLIRKGDRICQAIIQRLPDVELIEVKSLGDSERGAGGFGSSGVRSGEEE